jgi:hypothetical protein
MRIAFAAVIAVLFYALLLTPSGSPQDNTLVYSRREVANLTEFKLEPLKPTAPVRVYPEGIPATPNGFMQNLKHRRVICIIPGEELLVFEAVSTRDLSSLIADDVAQVRKKLLDINALKNDYNKLGVELNGKALTLGAVLKQLRSAKETPTDSLKELYRKAAAGAVEISDSQGRYQALGMEVSRQELLYGILRLRLAATLNAASGEREFQVLNRRKPDDLTSQLNDLLRRTASETTDRLNIMDSRISRLRSQEKKLMVEAFDFTEEVDALTMLRLIADGSVQMADKLYQHPALFADFLENELEVAANDAKARELASFYIELTTMSGQTVQNTAPLHAIDQASIGLRDFDRPFLPPEQRDLITRSAGTWGLGAWNTFIISLAASFAEERGRPVSVPPRQGSFGSPETLRLAGNEVPAFLAAVSALPEDDRNRLADIIDEVQEGYAEASAKQSEDLAFWAFANGYLQLLATRTGG